MPNCRSTATPAVPDAALDALIAETVDDAVHRSAGRLPA